MDKYHAAVAALRILFVSLENARDLGIECIRRRKLSSKCPSANLAPVTDNSNSYVEILEFQQTRLIKGLQELYRRTQNDQGWSGAPLDESENGAPLTHEILERIGALKRDAREEPPHDIYGRRLSALQQDMVLEPSGPPLKKRKVSTRESCSDHCESSRLAKYGSLVPPPSDTCGHSEPRGFDFDALYSHSTSTTPPEMFSNSPRFEASDEKQIFTGSLFLLNDESELINDLGFPMEYYYQSHDDFTTVSAINPDLSQVLDGAGENPGTPRLGRHLGFGSSVRPTASLGEHQQCTSMACKSCYDVSNYDAY